jgi:hypothetical protein
MLDQRDRHVEPLIRAARVRRNRQQHSDLSALQGKIVRLKIRLQKSDAVLVTVLAIRETMTTVMVDRK